MEDNIIEINVDGEINSDNWKVTSDKPYGVKYLSKPLVIGHKYDELYSIDWDKIESIEDVKGLLKMLINLNIHPSYQHFDKVKEFLKKNEE